MTSRAIKMPLTFRNYIQDRLNTHRSQTPADCAGLFCSKIKRKVLLALVGAVTVEELGVMRERVGSFVLVLAQAATEPGGVAGPGLERVGVIAGVDDGVLLDRDGPPAAALGVGEDAADDRAGHSVRCPNFAFVVLNGLGRRPRAL